jgi:hypothetical protein
MVSKKILIVFVMPVVLSLIFGSIVLIDILQKPDRKLNLWPMTFTTGFSSNTEITIIGLSSHYSTSEPVKITVKINDFSFDCGDLYVTIYSQSNDVITQGGFFEQCFGTGGKTLPIGDTFSRVIDTPGSYKIVVEMLSKELLNVSTSGTFIVQ